MRRIMVVANQTLGGDHLAEAIKARIAEKPTRFSLLVPATHGADFVVAMAEAFAVQGGMRPPAPSNGDDPDAGSRLAAGIEWMRGLGATVDGQVGDHDPVRAIREYQAGERVDEIIISTLPHGLSQWLHLDLPHRVGRHCGVPVAVVSAKTPVQA
jgi:GABA permease